MLTHWSVRYQLLLVLGVLLAFSSTQAMAETYVAGMAGITVVQPGDISNSGVSGVSPGSARQDQHYSNSVMYGAKLGHYFDSTPWLGVEGEVFNTTPHAKQQDLTSSTGQNLGTVSGTYQRVLTLAANAMVRVPGETLQPYAGVGPAIFFARAKDSSTGDSSSTTVVGLNALAGVRYLLTKQLVVFVEAKYNHAKFNYADFGTKVNYDAFHGAAGVGFQF